MAFYEYRQNNSGGGFDFDAEAGISVHVIIEADSAAEANRKAEEIGLYFDGAGDCPCCGDRWYEAGEWRGDAPARPLIYGTPIEDYDFHDRLSFKWISDGPEAYVHFANGLVQGYGLPKKELS